MKIARRSQVPPFAVMDVIAAANARRAAGHRVINLCAGEPSGGASELVRDRARAALEHLDLGYTEALGIPELRSAIAEHYGRWYHVDVDPAAVAVTTGASGAFVLAFLTAFDPGDRVALVRPGYPAYRNLLTTLGCEVVEVDCGPETRFQPTPGVLDEVVAHNGPINGLMVAGPANPTGTLIEPTALEEIAQWCQVNDVRLISDEIYHGITYTEPLGDGAHGPGAPSAARHVPSGAVVVGSFSKYWAMTGWRLGWLLLPEELRRPVDALAGNLALSPPALSQQAALAAFTPEGYAAADANVATYARSRQVLLDRIDELGWTSPAPADGAFYLYADVSSSGLDSTTYCARLLDEAGVALTPGTDFDPVNGHSRVRLSFATTPQIISEAVDAIRDWRASIT